ncbi:MAG: Spy/CpxP family protein refolding chaperone [Chitinispirillales bacterium]|jgi:Spy/CpxP family protein refolding chaperone|nr:Spy/CpxP family protein refolding chaperone [Chitinispirillales bacterium]
MRIKNFIYLAFAAIVLLPTLGLADTGRREHPARQVWEELNLTPEQEAKFRDINARHAPARREHARLMEEVRTRINQELLKDRPNRNLLAQWAGQMGEYQKRMNIASVNHMLDVKGVLTPEQFKMFTDRVSIGRN